MVPLFMLMVFVIFSDAAVLIGLLVFVAIAVSIGVSALAIIAAVAAGNRKPYRYPLTLRLIK